MVQGKLANNEGQKLDSHHIGTLIIKKNSRKIKTMFKKPIKVLKNIGQTLSTTVLGKDFLSISPWTEIKNAVTTLTT